MVAGTVLIAVPITVFMIACQGGLVTFLSWSQLEAFLYFSLIGLFHV
jgi:hypothetical protein